MSDNYHDEKGEWLKVGDAKLLIVPSDSYLQYLKEQELLMDIIPDQEEIQNAEFEIKIITFLQELGMI